MPSWTIYWAFSEVILRAAPLCFLSLSWGVSFFLCQFFLSYSDCDYAMTWELAEHKKECWCKHGDVGVCATKKWPCACDKEPWKTWWFVHVLSASLATHRPGFKDTISALDTRLSKNWCFEDTSVFLTSHCHPCACPIFELRVLFPHLSLCNIMSQSAVSFSAVFVHVSYLDLSGPIIAFEFP